MLSEEAILSKNWVLLRAYLEKKKFGVQKHFETYLALSPVAFRPSGRHGDHKFVSTVILMQCTKPVKNQAIIWHATRYSYFVLVLHFMQNVRYGSWSKLTIQRK